MFHFIDFMYSGTSAGYLAIDINLHILSVEFSGYKFFEKYRLSTYLMSNDLSTDMFTSFVTYHMSFNISSGFLAHNGFIPMLLDFR